MSWVRLSIALRHLRKLPQFILLTIHHLKMIEIKNYPVLLISTEIYAKPNFVLFSISKWNFIVIQTFIDLLRFCLKGKKRAPSLCNSIYAVMITNHAHTHTQRNAYCPCPEEKGDNLLFWKMPKEQNYIPFQMKTKNLGKRNWSTQFSTMYEGNVLWAFVYGFYNTFYIYMKYRRKKGHIQRYTLYT